jgi:hypothetical protein
MNLHLITEFNIAEVRTNMIDITTIYYLGYFLILTLSQAEIMGIAA